MGVTLEGLAKFAHLINAEFFGDLLVVLRELVQERQQTLGQDGHAVEFKDTTTREALLCIVTAFALLQGQVGESMNIDLSFFVSHFYSTLYSLALNPDIEFSNKTLRLDDPLSTNNSVNTLHTKNNVNISTEMEMVIRVFESIFFVQKSVSKLKVQAFTKRLSISSLHFPEKSTIAALKILDKLSKKFSVVNELYSVEDRVANGLYRMDVDIPEHSNPEAATIWETAILGNHYSPGVAFAVKSILGNVRSRK
jgi:nucleolar complex protein 3